MKRLLSLALVAAAACSSGGSDSGTLPPGQVRVDGEGPSTEPGRPIPPPITPSPPPTSDPLNGCPSTRPFEEVPTAVLTGPDDFRARIAGVYVACQNDGTRVGLELRPEADSEKVRWYQLDDRFVRVQEAGGSGWIEVGTCDGPTCTASWYSDSMNLLYAAQVTLWTDPLALERLTDNPPYREEWVRVAQ